MADTLTWPSYKMWVQFISLHSLYQWIHYFFTGPRSLQLVNSFKIQWNHLAYRDTFCCNVKNKFLYYTCHNLSLRLATKARANKSPGQKGSLEVTFHAPGSAKECEGMNPHTPKGIPTLRVGFPVDFWIFRERLQ
jgi:hypothetical protein